MDKLTLIALANHQPRRAVHFVAFSEDPTKDAVFGSRECAACCLRVNETADRLRLNVYSAVVLGVLPEGAYPNVLCSHCQQLLEYE